MGKRERKARGILQDRMNTSLLIYHFPELVEQIDGVQLLYPDLLNSSIAAWQSSKDVPKPSQSEDPLLKTPGDGKQKKPSAFSKFFEFARRKERKTKGKGKETSSDQQEPVNMALVSDRNGDEVVIGNTSELDTRKAKRSKRIPILRNCFSSKDVLD